MANDVMPQHETGTRPQPIQRLKDNGQILIDFAFELFFGVRTQRANHKDTVGLIGFAGDDFQVEHQAVGSRQ
ncbi:MULTISPECIES: hypothetical protein [Pseudomonas]|uniref:hypothetical protein n=1 Tax=Pseudomonas TaxID=286 RepID=UPI00210A9920|nr:MULTISPECIES: hypothetical protein [Pseudomonas]WSO21843.1 hypothetical protein VUJ50_14640 [Pseudomonas fluorescens]